MVEAGDGILWRFKDYLGLQRIEERLKDASIAYSRHSTTVSYFLSKEEGTWLQSYELNAVYSGALLPNGDPEVEKTYLKTDYRLIPIDGMSEWTAGAVAQQITESEFYGMILYANPDRVMNLHQISFRAGGAQYLVELNLESKMLVLIGFGEGRDRIPAVIADMILPEGLSRSSYLLALFENNGGPLCP